MLNNDTDTLTDLQAVFTAYINAVRKGEKSQRRARALMAAVAWQQVNECAVCETAADVIKRNNLDAEAAHKLARRIGVTASTLAAVQSGEKHLSPFHSRVALRLLRNRENA